MRLLSEDSLLRCGIAHRTHILLGLSGGADSVALLLLLHESLQRGWIGGLSAAHFNHCLRGADADADEAFCRDLCRSLGLPFFAGRGDVRAFAAANRMSEEQAARTLRYRFLRERMAACGADCIATAHHADDQAETLLLHLLRGSGMAGLCGMQPRTGEIVRPLLHITRAQLLSYLEERGQPFCTDASNADTAHLRNRVRHLLLPALSEYNPQIVRALCGTAQLLSEDEAYLGALADGALQSARRDGGYERLRLLAEPGPVRRRALLLLLRESLDGDVRRSDVARVEALLPAQAGTCIELRRGKKAWLDGALLRLGEKPESAAFSCGLTPGMACSVAGWRVLAERAAAYRRPESPMQACLSLDGLGGDAAALSLRSRRPGDRFRPLGCGGSRLLSDVFTDRKTPERLREVPLLVCGEEILFVPGYTVAERVRVRPESKSIIYIVVEEDLGIERQGVHGHACRQGADR